MFSIYVSIICQCLLWFAPYSPPRGTSPCCLCGATVWFWWLRPFGWAEPQPANQCCSLLTQRPHCNSWRGKELQLFSLLSPLEDEFLFSFKKKIENMLNDFRAPPLLCIQVFCVFWDFLCSLIQSCQIFAVFHLVLRTQIKYFFSE